jgi:hypothetical protein
MKTTSKNHKRHRYNGNRSQILRLRKFDDGEFSDESTFQFDLV